MGLLSERINTWVEDRITAWKARLRGWAVEVISLGIEAFFNVLGKAGAEVMKPVIERMERTGKVPPEAKPLLDKLKTPSGEWQGAVGMMAGSAFMGGAIGAMMDALFMPLARNMMSQTTPMILEAVALVILRRRGVIDDFFYYSHMAEHGFDKVWSDYFMQSVESYPGVGDIVRMAVREAFTPEIAEKFGQYEDFPEAAVPIAEKAGIPRDILTWFWAAHWDLPSAMLGYEMLHRGIITEGELKMLLRALDVMPFWRDKLIAISWNVPTRVDVRRFWEMGTIDETRLREIYTGLGYHGKDLEDYILWTKVYVALPDLLARWKNGWINEEDIRSELAKLGMPKERIDTVIETKVKAAQPERTVKEKELTKSEIVKGVKTKVISWDEGLDLLMDLGYEKDEADFILAINITTAAGSPETYDEYKDLTSKYRLAAGREVKPMPEELKKAGAEVVRLTKEVESLKRSVAEEEAKLVKVEPLPEEATKKLNELRVALHRAEATLSAARTHYDGLLAQWKHGG